MKIRLICIPCYEWNKLKNEKEKRNYLKETILWKKLKVVNL